MVFCSHLVYMRCLWCVLPLGMLQCVFFVVIANLLEQSLQVLQSSEHFQLLACMYLVSTPNVLSSLEETGYHTNMLLSKSKS